MEQAVNKRFVIIGCKDTDKEAIARPTITYGQDAWRRLKKNPIAMISLGVLVLMALVALLGPLLCGQDFAAMEPTLKNLPPSAQHWFGTDMLGRDLFARVCVGARISLLIALVCTLVQVVVGCAYGGIMAYFGGWVDNIMMRIVEVLISVPYLIVVILMSVVLDSKSLGTMLLAMTITGWCGTARFVRAQMLQLKSAEYTLAAQALGVSPWKTVVRHFIPNTMGVIIVSVTFDIPGYIFSEAFLSYMNLGIQPPGTSWGVLVSSAQSQFQFYPNQLIFPALMIALTMLCFTLIGDGLRDALDPKDRK